MIDRRELRKRTLLGGNKNYSNTGNSRTHIRVRARDVGVDQVTSPVTENCPQTQGQRSMVTVPSG